jgi:hypothetical protein
MKLPDQGALTRNENYTDFNEGNNNQGDGAMFKVNDTGGNVIFTFTHDRILDRSDKALGYVRKGVVCDKEGTPAQCKVEENNIMYLDLQSNKEAVALSVQGTNIIDSGVVGAVVVGASSHEEIMLGAAAYYEFVWSLT